jgi:hypothetical protein
MTVIACALTPEAIRAGRQGLLPGLAARAVAREPLDDGYLLTFNPAPDIIGLIGRVIDAERQCCPWLTFTLKVAAGAGPIELQLHGPTGAREFLAALFDV